MTGGLSHPAVRGVLAAIPARDLAPFAVAERGGVVAVVVQNDTARYIVLVERHENEWVVPTAISGGGRPGAMPRPAETEGQQALRERVDTQSGWPADDGGPPEFAWCAVTGVAARDAREVRITSTVEESTVPIRDDGFVLGVVQARWHESPAVTVRTSDGRLTTDRRP